MRIVTWNVNVLRTVLDYHPWSSMPNKTVEGLLEELKADIACFQEHKTRRPQWTKPMACPGPYDCFLTFPRQKAGYSGVCTYVDSRVCVPVYAEEGMTGLLLGDSASTMKPPWAAEERIGHYPAMSRLHFDEEVEGVPFDPRTLDMEGRAVLCDFGMFVLFNLYCPNETNEQRRPYKMNFYAALEARVNALRAAGREVIVAGDMNVMRAPIDSGEGCLQTIAEQHYSHPARVWFDNWCAPKGPMIDVVRESFPDRPGMFTCWNTKIDARPANYGSRIDYILCTPGLRPWIKGGDIQAELYGSDHCPVYVDLHDSIELPSGDVAHIRDLLNPPNRPPSTAPVYPSEPPREGPRPPRFATMFFDEFSAKQQTLKSLWAVKVPRKSASPTLGPGPSTKGQPPAERFVPASAPDEPPTESLSVAKLAPNNPVPERPPSAPGASQSSTQKSAGSLGDSKRPAIIDLTRDDFSKRRKTAAARGKSAATNDVSKVKGPAKTSASGQRTLAHFFTASASASSPKPQASKHPPALAKQLPRPTAEDCAGGTASGDDDEKLALALAAAEQEKEDQARERAAKNEAAAPIWTSLFAKKLPPKCVVHNEPCKIHTVMKTGFNKGKRFWLCSRPVGPGYDSGQPRPTHERQPQFRCDFFLWDSANSLRGDPTAPASK